MRFHLTTGARFALVRAIIAIGAAAFVHGANAGDTFKKGPEWVGSWATTTATVGSPPIGAPPNPFAGGFANQTIRQVVPLTVGGDAIRLRISNVYGDRPLKFDSVYVATQQNEATVASGSSRAVSFGGRADVTVQKGAVVISDPLPYKLPDLANLTVSMYSAEATGLPTAGLSGAISYVGGGNQAALDAGTFSPAGAAWFLTGVDVVPDNEVRGAIVVLGDSTSAGGRTAWPGVLASQIVQKHSVLNVAIGGNRILTDSECNWWVSAVARFDRDVLLQTGVHTVVMLEGINDIGFGYFTNPGRLANCVRPAVVRTADELIDAVKQLVARAHARGIRFIGGTVTPYKGWVWYSEAGEATREAFNNWIRTTDELDGYVDFDKVLADPLDPLQIRRGWTEDNLHPNVAGHKAMGFAAAIQLRHTLNGGHYHEQPSWHPYRY